MTSRMDRARKVDNTEKSASVNRRSKKKSRSVLGRQNVTAEVERAINVFVDSIREAGIDSLRRAFSDVKNYRPASSQGSAEPMKQSVAKWRSNESRNRSKSLPCVEGTRCVLTVNVPPDTDYIHANHVKMEHVERQFIATQTPLESTVPDFWRLVYQENASTIIMLCKKEDEDKSKPYWPMEANAYKNYGPMFVSNKKVLQEDRFISYTLEVLPEGCSNSVIAKLVHVVDWPDDGVPQSAMSVLRILKSVPSNKAEGPCIIHCAYGTGPTGTILLVETAVSRLWKGHVPNMREIVHQLRDKRAGLVANEVQFVFAHIAVLCYISAKIPKYREFTFNFYDKFRHFDFGTKDSTG